jgi:hypothetical protein
MSFVLFLSIVAMTTAIVGCAAIWGFDVARAREVERDVAETAAQRRELAAAQRRELATPTADPLTQ